LLLSCPIERNISDAAAKTDAANAEVESFLADVLALTGEEPDVIRDEVRVALGDYRASAAVIGRAAAGGIEFAIASAAFRWAVRIELTNFCLPASKRH
jgi:hypothetical protein